MSVDHSKYALTAAQMRAAEILALNDYHQMTTAEIAEEIGVSERTIYRWKKDPNFIAYQNELADKIMESFIAEAYSELRKIVRFADSDNVRIKALDLFLKNRGKLKDIGEKSLKIEDNRSNEVIQSEINFLKDELAKIDAKKSGV